MNNKILSILRIMGIGFTLGIGLLVIMNCVAPIQRVDAPVSSVITPKTTDELIGNAQLIFIGEVGPVTQYRTYSGYGPNGELLDGADLAGNPLPTIPITEFSVKIEKLLRDDGTVANGKPVTLRMGGHVTAELRNQTRNSDFPFSFTGDRYLFVLCQEPDKAAYSFCYGPWGRLIIDGNLLRVSNGEQQLLKLDGIETPVELTTLIERVEKNH